MEWLPKALLSPGAGGHIPWAPEPLTPPAPGASLPGKDGQGLVGSHWAGQPRSGLSRWGLSQAAGQCSREQRSEPITVGSVPRQPGQCSREQPILEFLVEVCPRAGRPSRRLRGIKAQWERPPPTLCAAPGPCHQQEPPSRMLQTLLISGTLALLAQPQARPSPHPDDFDASQSTHGRAGLAQPPV